MLRAAVIILLIALLPSPARAEARIALLIGNEAYGNEIGRLANPHNDVALLEGVLKGLGFEVTVASDAGLGALTRAVNAYARRLQAAGPGAIAFFYYSGHGASDGNTNYLIPIDVKTTETGELWDQSLRLNDVTRRLKAEAGNATHFVVFDACRNTLKLTQPGSRAVVQSKGFVPVAQENGMLIAYATAEGELASDVGTGAGPYAKVLAEEIVKPGIEAVVMFRAVQRRVRAAIRQEPYLGFNALGDIYLAGKGEQPAAAPPSPQRLSEPAEAWTVVKDTTNIADLEAFLARFKGTYYADLARLRIEELKKQQDASGPSWWDRLTGPSTGPLPKAGTTEVAVATPPAPPAPPTLKEPAAAITPVRCDGIEVVVGLNERRCFKPGAGKTQHFRDCPTCPEMVVVPAGSFTMGSPANEPERLDDEAQVRVSVPAPIAVGRFAVTFDGWDACGADGGCNGYMPGDEGWGRGKHPVINVNWDDAKAYVSWLLRKTGKTYRLLSEAEREYVTRAGTTTPFWWGSSIKPTQANYDGSRDPYEGGGSKGEYRQRTVPVDSFEPNPWGLYNVHGNVYDWTEDCSNDSNTGNPGDGSARTSGDCSRRVVRWGFSWWGRPRTLRSAYRVGHKTDRRDDDQGFRLARTLHP
jgi:formylglycine-generating enzyme required for sulfatase activity